MPSDVKDMFPRLGGTDTVGARAGARPNPTPARVETSPHEIRERLRKGGEVQLIGHPATMTREAFQELVAAHGGTLKVNFVGARSTAIFVVGQREWPLTKDGTLPDHLRELIARGRREKVWSVVVPEEQFLTAIGKAEWGEAVHRLYTTTTLTEVLGVAAETIRGWVKAGLIKPVTTTEGVWHFDFRQVTAARTLTNLARCGVSIRRMRRSLLGLRQWLPDVELPLEQLAIIEQDGRLMVRLAEGDLAEPDGQLQLDFETGPAPLKMPLSRGATPATPHTAAQWYQQGLEQEANGYPAEAAESYRKALKAGGPDARTCFNLANALRELGLRRESVERYEQAIETDPDFIDAWNNLGTTLSELGRHEEAILAFREILARRPDDPVAHYNLADELETTGCPHDARPHWEAYLRHDRLSAHAAHARSRLA
jgi:Flp pilus assembly protein TadD